MNNLEQDTEGEGQKKNLVSQTKLSKVNRRMKKSKLSGKKDFNKKTPEFLKALEKAQLWR